MPTEHCEYVVADGDAGRATDAVLRYQLTRPQFWVVLVVFLAAACTALVSGWDPGAVATSLVAFFLGLSAVLLIKRRQLRSAMVARGYRPGGRLSTDFDADGFTVTSSVGSAVHRYADMSFVASAGGMVLLRLRPARLLVVLPAALLPAERLPALRR